MSGVTRLEKVGTIFARLNAMLKKNVMYQSEKPIWYEIYALHPPYDEPRYDRPGSEDEVRELLYEDDLIRAKFHEQVKRLPLINLNDHHAETETKKFINLYKTYKAQGALDDEKVFEVALKQVITARKQKPIEDDIEDHVEQQPADFGLIESFTKANETETKTDSKPPQPKKKDGKSIDISKFF